MANEIVIQNKITQQSRDHRVPGTHLACFADGAYLFLQFDSLLLI